MLLCHIQRTPFSRTLLQRSNRYVKYCTRAQKSGKNDLPSTLSSVEVWTPLLISASLITICHITSSGDAIAATETLKPSIESSHMSGEVYRLAENEDFWANIARYGRFFFSVIVGTIYTAMKPLQQLLKRPVTAAVIIGGAVLIYFFVSATLRGMLGLSDFDYSL